MSFDDCNASGRAPRDSVFLHATVKATHGEDASLVRIRNISSGGLMAEGPIMFVAGDELDIGLRNVGTIHGRVTWSSAGRFGMQFDRTIDPKLARKPVGKGRPATAPTTSAPFALRLFP